MHSNTGESQGIRQKRLTQELFIGDASDGTQEGQQLPGGGGAKGNFKSHSEFAIW